MNLTANFTLYELLRSEVAQRKGYKEQFNPPEEVIENLRKLAVNVLQPLRDELSLPIRTTSGYRCRRANKALGGANTSHHVKGMAADSELYVDGEESNLYLAKTFLRLDIPFTQLILEYGTLRNPAWIHFGYNENDLKKQVLRAEILKGKTVYSSLSATDVLFL